MAASMNRFAKRASAIIVAGSIALPLVSSFFFVVQPGTAVVKFDLYEGVVQKVFKEGFHLFIPVLQQRFVYETRSRFVIVKTTTGTKDLQNVNITLRILFRPNENTLPNLHQSIGHSYDSIVLPSISNDTLKAVVAQYNAEEIITKREVVSAKIRHDMQQRAAQNGIILDDISLIDTSFTEEFARAVEQKQVAQQEAERHKYIVLRNEHLRDAAVTKAQGEANSAEMISKAFKSHGMGLLEMRRLEAAVKAAGELAKNPHVTYVPAGLTGLLPLRGQSAR